MTDPYYYRLPFTGPYGSWGDEQDAERRAGIAEYHRQNPPMRLGWRW